MILTTAADTLKLIPFSITTRVRIVFFIYGILSASYSVVVWQWANPAIDWIWLYQIIFPVGALTCFYMTIRPSIGMGSLILFPLFLGSAIRILDIWLNYFREDITLDQAARGTISWTFLLVSIAFIDLLESRIYHRMVLYIDETSK